MLKRYFIQTGILCEIILSGAVFANDTDRIAPAILTFKADWSIEQEGVVVAETELELNYDISRLSRCRAKDGNGFDNWKIQALVSIDGSNPVAFDLLGGQGTSYMYDQKARFTVPRGQELIVWFKGSDVTGCVEWDSAYGQNYRFAIGKLQDIPLLSFNADWTVNQTGTLLAGQAVRLHYDLNRATTCRAYGYLGTASWDVFAHALVDGKEVKIPALTFPKYWDERGQQDVIFIVPDGHEMTIWFENTSYEYYTGMSCRSFDSDFGRNYNFSVN